MSKTGQTSTPEAPRASMVRPLRSFWGIGIVLCLLVIPARARSASPAHEASLDITESTRARLLVHLSRGDIAGAIAMYETHTGQRAPVWLKSLQVAYSAASQLPGRCQDVARSIHTAFSQLGKSPEYITFKGNSDYMMFELASGKQVPMSRTGYHVAVRLGEGVHDAYTGPLGMKLSDYLARLHARGEVAWEIVSKP